MRYLILNLELLAGGCAPVNLACPSCKQIGTFARVADNVHDANITSQKRKGPTYANVVIDIGIRTCPNTDCKAVVFVAKEIRVLQRLWIRIQRPGLNSILRMYQRI